MRLIKLQEVQCMECTKDVIMAIQLGGEPGWDNYIDLCIPCLEKAVNLVQEDKPEIISSIRKFSLTRED